LEKIYNRQIKKNLEKGSVNLIRKMPFLKNLVYKKINQKLINVFGGKFWEIIIGGAALNKEVERFLKQIGFPFTVGYGMTECGPLISYASWKEHREGSVGKAVTGMEVKIASNDPENVVGEILVRGENIMLGY
jgi:long-chain acyl-CoA synthetase